MKKNVSILILSILVISIIANIPLTFAHDPPWEIPTYAYLSVTPDPIGVGQSAFVVMQVDKVMPGALVTNDIRHHDYKLTITKPDGTAETKNWLIVMDTTSSQFATYTPDQIGTYTFKFDNLEQVYAWSGSYQNDTYLASSATATLTVQEAQIENIPVVPLPTSYWTRPIEGQNTAWYSIGSSWLDRTPGAGYDNVSPDGIAPNSAHVMWTKPLEFGGIVGGDKTGVLGADYYSGMSYESRFQSPIIIQGRLYYRSPLGNDANDGPYICVDLTTGETIWENPDINPSFGQLLWYDSPNQHGVLAGYLWQTQGSTWRAYDAMTGLPLFNLTGVPSGTNYYGPNGEIIRYRTGGDGQWMALWNNTASLGLQGGSSGANSQQWRPVGKSVDMSAAYSWNVTISQQLPDDYDVRIVIYDDVLIGSAPGFPSFQSFGTPDPYTLFAISLKPQSLGQVLWNKEYAAPAGNVSRFINRPLVDLENRTFIMLDKETRSYWGYSLDSGNLVWGPTSLSRGYDYYSATLNQWDSGAHQVAYGTLYAAGYGGILYAFDAGSGDLKWTYGNGGVGNSSNSGIDTPWGYYPLMIGNIADGKLYLFTSEHSPNSPKYKGALIRCIDAFTGEELWTISGWASRGSFYAQAGVIADGIYVFFNTYDGQLYAIGKGPSKTTVTAPDVGIPLGGSIMIRGTVIDQSAGAKAVMESGEFNVVAAVSDASMGDWMEYIHMQKPKPIDAIGVTVRLTAYDPNGNFQEIGSTVTDANGNFGFSWVPPVPGDYYIAAQFEGSESYWPSEASTYMTVEMAPEASPAPTPTPVPPTDTYVLGLGIAALIAIVVMGLLILMKLGKK